MHFPHKQKLFGVLDNFKFKRKLRPKKEKNTPLRESLTDRLLKRLSSNWHMHTKHSINITLIIIDSKASESYQIRVCLLHLHAKQTGIITLNAKVALVLFPAVCLYSESSLHTKLCPI